MRAYLDGMTRLPQPVKLWYCQSHFRYNAVQRGRAREHYQFGVEVVGSADAAVDAEVIALQHRWYRLCGVPELRLELNSIGDAVCRPAYVELLVAFIDAHIDQLDDECLERRTDQPAARAGLQEPVPARRCWRPRLASPTTSATTAPQHFAEVRRQLDARGVALRARADAGARPRLLHAHRLGVERRRPGHVDLGRRPLRRPGRADRRAAHARGRVRRRASSGCSRWRGRSRRRRPAACCSR